MRPVQVSGKALNIFAALVDRLNDPSSGRVDSLPVTLFDGTDATKVAEVAAMLGVDDIGASLRILEAKDTPEHLRLEAKDILAAKMAPAPDDDLGGVAVMLKLSPEDAAKVAQEDGVAPEDLHCTLAYYGKVKLLDESYEQGFLKSLQDIANGQAPFTAKLNGLTRFAADEQDPIVVNVDSPVVEKLRRQVMDMAVPVEQASEHGFTPHMTLGYVSPSSDMPMRRWNPVEVTFTGLTLAWGKKHTDIQFAVTEGKDIYGGGSINPGPVSGQVPVVLGSLSGETLRKRKKIKRKESE